MEQEDKIKIADSNNSILAPISSSEDGEVNIDSKNITIYNVLSNIGMADKINLGVAFARKDYQSVGEILIKAGLLDLVPNGQEISSIYSSVTAANENIKLSGSSFSNEVPVIEKSFSKQSIEGLSLISFLWNTGILFSLIGMVLLLISNFYISNEYQLPVFSLGILLITVNLILFILLKVKGLQKATKAIKENEQMLDELQQISANLTQMTENAYLYANKNMDTIKELLDKITPSLGRLGLVSIKNQEKISANIHTYYSSLNEYSHEIQTTIKELKDALVEGDSKKLEEFSLKTKKLVQKVSEYVKKASK